MAASRDPAQGRLRAILPLPARGGARTSLVRRPLRLPSPTPSLPAKFGLVLGAVAVLSLAALFALQQFQRQATADLLASEMRARSAVLEQAVRLTGRPLRDLTSDYSQWDDMVRFVREPKRVWAANNLEASLAKFELSGLWVLAVDGTVVYGTRGEGTGPPPPLPLPPATLQAMLAHRPVGTFFARLPDRVVELCLAPVQPSADTQRVTPPRGWLLAEKTWAPAQVQLLSQLTRSRGKIAAAGGPLPALPPHEFVLRHPLRGADGETVADFVCVIRSEALEIASNHNRTVFLLFGFCGFVSAALATTALYRWVLRPLASIADSLAHNDLAPIASLVPQTDEMGRLARLVETTFAQRVELQRNLAERSRLSRDLHDGAIQTVYAAGMSLGGVRATLRTDPATAENAIDGVRDALNATLRDLRAFIDGLDPASNRPTHFGEAVRSILALMQGVRPVNLVLHIDDALADQLPASVRLHLLQIVREAASNSVRHSQARTLQINLRREADLVSLEISDDGAGLAASAEPGQGRGLANLAVRTRELGGNLSVASQPGQGLRLQLTFPRASHTGTPNEKSPHPEECGEE